MIGGTEGEVQKSSPFSWKIGPKVSHSWLSFANNYSHFGALPMIQYIINCLGSDSRKPKRKAPRRLSLETMERRELFATDLLSVVSAGNGTDETIMQQVATDRNGNRYVTGSFGGTVDFDPSASRIDGTDILSAQGKRDGFVAKYTQNDALAWIRIFGSIADTGVSDDAGSGIAIDGEGNVLVSGRFAAGTARFGNVSIVSSGGVDGLVAKLDPDSGSTQWVKTWGSTKDDRGGLLAVDGSGNAYVTIDTYNNGSLYPAVGIALQKFNTGGIKQWQKDFATTSTSAIGMAAIRGVAAHPDGRVVIVGTVSQATTDLDPSTKRSLIATSLSTAFAAQYSASGALQWASPFYPNSNTSSAGSAAASVTIDGQGSVLVGGAFRGSVDFNPGLGTNWIQGSGGFLAKLSSTNGSLTWARPFLASPSSTNDYASYVLAMATDGAGNIFATGIFRNSVDFDPGSGVALKSSAGNWDVFMLSLSVAGELRWVDSIGTFGDDWVNDLAIDSLGNISIVGAFYGTLDFDPNLGIEERTAIGNGRAGYLARYRRT